MATKKGSKKSSSKKGSGKAAAAQSVSIQDATRIVQDAVGRAIKSRQVQPRIRGPIFLGIWYNPATKKLEVVNQFE